MPRSLSGDGKSHDLARLDEIMNGGRSGDDPSPRLQFPDRTAISFAILRDWSLGARTPGEQICARFEARARTRTPASAE
jgi:hypothetical protein